MRLNYLSQRGVSLIEVLVAIIVFSLGLLGLLSAAALTIRTNQDAYVNTQVVNVAEYLIGAMRANPMGVQQVNYAGTLTATDFLSATAPTSCQATVCTAAAVATSDLQRVQLLMGQYLPPDAKITVLCDPQTLIPAVSGFTLPVSIPPYNGRCRITQSWKVDRAGTIGAKTWIFQP